MEFFIAFVLSVILNRLFKLLGTKLKLFDRPQGTLKPHEKPITYMGGTAILLTIFPWFLFYPEYFLPFVLMWLVGLLDDLKGLSPKLRLFMELLAGFATSFIIFGHSILDSLVLALLFAATVNAYNMVDGLDGICAGNIIVFSFFAFMTNFVPDMSLAVAGAFAGYLVFNFPPAKLFMGDQGSYLAGTFVGLLLIQNWGSQNFVRLTAFCWPVLLDLIVVFARRSLAGKSPFKGDRDHYYDKIFALTGKRKRVTLLISTGLALLYALIGFFIPVKLIPLSLLIASLIQLGWLKSLRST